MSALQSNQAVNRGTVGAYALVLWSLKLLVQRIKLEIEKYRMSVPEYKRCLEKMLALLLGSGRGSLSTHHYPYWRADLAMYWGALAFTLISDLRTSSILQDQIPWQGQALKHLMSSSPFAFKRHTSVWKGTKFTPGQNTLRPFSAQCRELCFAFTLQCTPVGHLLDCGLYWSNLKVPLALSAAQDQQEAILLVSQPGLDDLK